jgi:hypothetical protein
MTGPTSIAVHDETNTGRRAWQDQAVAGSSGMRGADAAVNRAGGVAGAQQGYVRKKGMCFNYHGKWDRTCLVVPNVFG